MFKIEQASLPGVRNGTVRFGPAGYAGSGVFPNGTRFQSGGAMSERNGDRARFQKDRKRKLLHRQRIQALVAQLRKRADADRSSSAASLSMPDEGGPVRTGN